MLDFLKVFPETEEISKTVSVVAAIIVYVVCANIFDEFSLLAKVKRALKGQPFRTTNKVKAFAQMDSPYWKLVQYKCVVIKKIELL